MIASGAPLAFTDTYVVQRRFDDVVKSLRQKADECLQVDVRMTRTSGDIQTMNTKDEYRMTMKDAIVVQQVPPGGFFNTAVDIERLTPATTKLTYYGSSLSSGKAKWDLLKQWSEGKAVPCP